MLLKNHKLGVLDLAYRWRLEMLTAAERLELETWFRAFEDESLGVPTEMSADKLEWRLHQMFNDQPERQDLGNGPPNPFR